MAVENETSRVQYTGNSSTVTPYPTDFRFLDYSELRVIVTNAAGVDTALNLTTDFTADGVNEASGGNVYTVLAYDNTHTITIYREVAATQTTEYIEGDSFPASSHERALDKLTMLVQQNARKVARAITVGESDDALAPLSAVALTMLGFDADKQARMLSSDQLAAFLNLTQQYYGEGTKAFLNAGDRAAAIPEFLGQIGVQIDDSSVWASDGVTAGDWTSAVGSIAPGSITTEMLETGILTADTDGLAKMADGYLAASTAGRAKMADLFITLAKIGTAIFTADATGRGKFAAGFVDSSLLATGAAQGNLAAGSIVQSQYGEYTGNAAITTIIPEDDSVPDIGEGTKIIEVSITPTNASNLLRFTFLGTGSSGSVSSVCALFKNSDAAAITGSTHYSPANGHATTFGFKHQQVAGSTSAQTYKLHVGPGQSGTMRVNGPSTGRFLGGCSRCVLVIEEIKV